MQPLLGHNEPWTYPTSQSEHHSNFSSITPKKMMQPLLQNEPWRYPSSLPHHAVPTAFASEGTMGNNCIGTYPRRHTPYVTYTYMHAHPYESYDSSCAQHVNKSHLSRNVGKLSPLCGGILTPLEPTKCHIMQNMFPNLGFGGFLSSSFLLYIPIGSLLAPARLQCCSTNHCPPNHPPDWTPNRLTPCLPTNLTTPAHPTPGPMGPWVLMDPHGTIN